MTVIISGAKANSKLSIMLTSLKVLDDTYQPYQRYRDGRQAKQKREHIRPPQDISNGDPASSHTLPENSRR